MARRRSGGVGKASSRSAPVRNPPAATSHAPPAKPAQGGASHAPPAAKPAQGGGSMFGSLGEAIADGLAWGTGNAIAHRAVESVMGPRVIHHETVVSGSPATASSPNLRNVNMPASCNIHSKAFQDCLDSNGSDVSQCQFYMDMLSQCRKNAGAAIGV